MGLDQEGAARRAREGTAVSSGDSSAVQPALSKDGVPRADSDIEATLPEGAVSPVPTPKTIPSPGPVVQPRSDPNEATIATPRRPRDPSSGTPTEMFASIGATILEVGRVLGGRYEIEKLLGMGGMGAVYKAHDLEVDRSVGLKVIRPDLAGNPAILARFKQELILARQVTHKNIIRIYDLSEAEGVKFITMEFIEGEDLRTILTRAGKLSADEAITIIRQSCTGLQAAHLEGVIHRDLKPSNIMCDASGRVVIMDFGLAKTVASDGLTQTGMMIGTMEYMSPEQAMGSELDARSDIFAMGLIFYEMLTGNMPYKAESAIASLVKRTQERAVPLSEVDPSVPSAVSQIVSKCLERDPKNRYASVQELLDDLDIAQGKRPSSHGMGPAASKNSALVGEAETFESPAMPKPAAVQTPGLPRKWLAVAAAVLVVALGVGGYYIVSHLTGTNKPPVQQAPAMSLAIIPYYNNTGDPSLDWLSATLSETLSTDFAPSAAFRQVSQRRIQQILADMKISPQQEVDLSQLNRIAEAVNADRIVTGKYVKNGDQILVTSSIDDLKSSQHFEVITTIPSIKDLLASLPKLADDVRAKLASSNPEMLKDLQSHAPRALTQSVEALKAYNEGLKLARAGNLIDAVKKFEDATNEDPEFALAYSELAQAYKTLGRDNEAENSSRKAVTLSNNRPQNEKFLIGARDAAITNNTSKAITEYEKLTTANPADTEAQFKLAELYEKAGNYDAARQRLQLVRQADQKNPDALLASGRIAIRTGNPQAALDDLNRAYNLALSSGNEALRASILQVEGIAYKKLNQPSEALKHYKEALAIRQSLKLELDEAASLNEIGQIQEKMGDIAGALVSYQQSLKLRQNLGNKSGVATSLLNLGKFYNDHAQYQEARNNLNPALDKFRELDDQPNQALCLNNIGTAEFQLGNYQTALTNYSQALNIRQQLKNQRDISETLHNLAETNVKLGQYDTAIQQYVKALDAWREAGDQRQVALESTSLGELSAMQGEYGKALQYYEDAVNGFKTMNDRTYLSVSALAGYGHVLAMVGRGAEGQQKLQEAVKRATEIKSDTYLAQALNWLGDSYMYAGENNNARPQYKKAAAVADRAKDKEQSAVAHFGLARLDVRQGHGKAAIPDLQKLVADADAIGLKALSVQASVTLAEALITADKIEPAQQEAARALNEATKLGLKVEQAQAHYWLGHLATVTNKEKQLGSEFRDAVNLLESVSKEQGAGHFLDRADIKPIYQEARTAYQGASH
jgi:tetratricopeptide (TPR) repeat protein